MLYDIKKTIEIAAQAERYANLIEQANQVELPPYQDLESAANECGLQKQRIINRLEDCSLHSGVITPLIKEFQAWHRRQQAILAYLDNNC